jgi:LPXTG-motif cell wall-anchored protein
MAHHILLLLLIGIACVLAAGVATVLLRRRKRTPAAEEPQPRSLVRVLRSDEELREAVGRAARFERMLADTMETRARRYEAMVQPSVITRIDAGLAFRAELSDDDAPRSA